jgi:AAA15 family ATPase/GTPase
MANLKLLTIKNFRGFDSLEIEGFSKINLFVGKNNSGKTSILEALFLLTGLSNPMLPANINQFRGLTIGTAGQLKYLFHNLKLDNKPSFYGKFGDETERKLDIEAKYKQADDIHDTSSTSLPEISGIDLKFLVTNAGETRRIFKSSISFDNGIIDQKMPQDYSEKLFGRFISEKNSNFLNSYSEIIKRKEGDSILKYLQSFDENIKCIQLLSDGIYIDIEDVDELVSIDIMGDGIKRFLNIITAVAEKKGSLLFIDEIENGLHYSAYKLLWKSLILFSKQNNVQLFITTHNIETLACLKAVLEEKEYVSMQDFAKVFTVAKTLKAGYQTYKYSFEGFKNAIEYETEIRN